MAELPDDVIDAAARAMALVDEENGCFERVDEFDAITDPLEAEDYIQAHGYPHDDREDCEYWRRRARAAFDVIAARVRAEAVAEIVEAIREVLPAALGHNSLPDIVRGIGRQRDGQHDLKDHLADVARRLTDERDRAVAEAVAELAADPAVTELRELWQRALEREGSLASAVADVIWKATPFGSTEDGDTFAYVVPKGCMHRLVGVAQQNGAHVPVAFRNSTEPFSEADAVAEAVAAERQRIKTGLMEEFYEDDPKTDRDHGYNAGIQQAIWVMESGSTAGCVPVADSPAQHEHHYAAHGGYCIEQGCDADGWAQAYRRQWQREQSQVIR